MKTENKIIQEITLTLTAREAFWLKSMCQNHLSPGPEGEEDRKIREEIFTGLPKFSELHLLGA